MGVDRRWRACLGLRLCARRSLAVARGARPSGEHVDADHSDRHGDVRPSGGVRLRPMAGVGMGAVVHRLSPGLRERPVRSARPHARGGEPVAVWARGAAAVLAVGFSATAVLCGGTPHWSTVRRRFRCLRWAGGSWGGGARSSLSWRHGRSSAARGKKAAFPCSAWRPSLRAPWRARRAIWVPCNRPRAARLSRAARRAARGDDARGGAGPTGPVI